MDGRLIIGRYEFEPSQAKLAKGRLGVVTCLSISRLKQHVAAFPGTAVRTVALERRLDIGTAFHGNGTDPNGTIVSGGRWPRNAQTVWSATEL